MRIIHLEFLPEFIGPILQKTKTETRRPLRVQPFEFKNGCFIFEDGSKVYSEDYPCPYGEAGDAIVFVPEASSFSFYEAKCAGVKVERIYDCLDFAAEGYRKVDDFIKKWDDLYGETPFASCFNPYVWVVKWQ